MVKRLLFLTTILITASQSFGQVYSYNFGTVADSITSGTATSPVVLPAPSDGAIGYARVGNAGGKVVIRNHAGFGTDASLRIQAPTSGSVNKFSVHSMPGGSSTFGVRFAFSIGDSVNSTSSVPDGVFSFFAGKGTSFSNASTFTGSHVFAGIQITNAPGGATVQYRNGSSWSTLPSFVIPYGMTNDIALYMNNGTTSVTYTGIDNASRSLAGGTWDLYVAGSYISNFPKGTLATDTAINSFMVYGASSTGNQANLFLDNILYTNNIQNNTLPLKLSFFDALPDNNMVRLFWKTEVETGIKDYTVEHSIDGIQFREAGKVASTKINGSSYTYKHNSPATKNFYRLKINNEDGTYEYSQIITARFTKNSTDIKAWYKDDVLHIAQHADAIIKIYDLGGRRIINQPLKHSEYSVDLSFLAPGIYIAHIESDKETTAVKFMR